MCPSVKCCKSTKPENTTVYAVKPWVAQRSAAWHNRVGS